ncbi:hypothetical protein QFC24_007095 [Naganishia onofrii]|uniref:Uncharacterized protein n=1 Tax=Naganishia onofrii TaxID=1851511 RepID=A0ACC2WTQ3_9TREE|nr:hypothetical protein QFC24_007095 [Naganishia onofrii]
MLASSIASSHHLQNAPLTRCAINQELRRRLGDAHRLDDMSHADQKERLEHDNSHDEQPPFTPSGVALPASPPATAKPSSVKWIAFGVVPKSTAISPSSAFAACQNPLLYRAHPLKGATFPLGTTRIVGQHPPATPTSETSGGTVNDVEPVKSLWTKRSKAEKKAAKETSVVKVVPGSQAAASAFVSTSVFEEAFSKVLAAHNLVNKSPKHSSPCVKASPTTRTSVADCPQEASKQSAGLNNWSTTLVFAPYKTKEEVSGSASVLKSDAEVANVVSSSTMPTKDSAPAQPAEVRVPSSTKLVDSAQPEVIVKSVATPTIEAPTATA